MQQRFLEAYQRIKPELTDVQPATGVWLLHGDDTLLASWLVERMRPIWQQHGMAISRMDITSSQSWQQILAELNSLSLFDDRKTIIAQGNHKPDKVALAQIADCMNTDNCLIIITDKYDRKSQSTGLFQLCSQQGMVVECQLYQESERVELLKAQAADFGLALTEPAWQELLTHTQNNLLTANQTLWRLSYLYAQPLDNPTTLVTLDEIQLLDGLVSQSYYTTFDLSGAMLAGDVQRVLSIIYHLKNSDEPQSLVLWAIAKDMRAIQSLLSGASYQSLGIWQSKQSLYQQAIRRHQMPSSSLKLWSDHLYRCDKAIKGLIAQPAWELLTQAALMVAGISLFSGTR